jgi:hypothetical protein
MSHPEEPMPTATLELALRSSTRTDHSRCLPLYLTEAEAETLLSLCSTSTLVSAELERQVFLKLGELLRGFRQ